MVVTSEKFCSAVRSGRVLVSLCVFIADQLTSSVMKLPTELTVAD